jgi:hypothetical protein
MPAQQCFGRSNRAKLAQRRTAHCLRLRGKVASLGIREDDATITKAAAKQAALGNEIVDHRRLLPMQPPSNDQQQKGQVTRPLTREVAF